MTSGRRPLPPPPRGWVTLHEAHLLSGLSYPEVHRRVAVAKTAPGVQDPETGVWRMRERDARRLSRRTPAQVRPGTNLRASPERWAAWEREAERRGLSVSGWLSKLADEASGWSGGGSEDAAASGRRSQ
jgi:hypothetical protein